MSIETCVLENHEPHDVPRLYTLHEEGELWFFHLCAPHVWPGSHWGVPDRFAGGVIKQAKTGNERSIAATGLSLDALRSAFGADLAFALGTVDDVFHGSVSITNDLGREVDWVPDLPASVPIVAIRHGLRCFPTTQAELRVVCDIEIDGWGDVVIDIADGTRLDFDIDADCWYILGDDPRIPTILRDLALRFNVELARNPEPLRDHRPEVAEWWYALDRDRT
jgi:hypothetical protein